MRAWVAIGSNLGDRWGWLAFAVRSLRAVPDVAVVRGSRVYDTEPVGPPQPRYLNAVLELETGRTPRALLEVLQATERSAGRTRTVRWGPRTLDLDLVLLGDRVVRERGLVVPHPELVRRRFVLAPLADLVPDKVVPDDGRKVGEILAAAPGLDVLPVGAYLV
jgi:2-amino-4-hydroxy-6-hydroxymethyldihydropteridine diphosphokinase